MNYILMMTVAFIISYLTTPAVIRLAIRLGAIDIPKDERRVHTTAIPRMGGLAIFISFFVVSLFTLKMNKQYLGLLFGSFFIVIMGMIDDIKQLKPLTKLFVQIASALILIFFGIFIKSISIPFMGYDKYFNLGYFGFILTILWVVGITNAVNLIDGLDGLACGIGSLSLLTLFIISLLLGRHTSDKLSIILLGSCLGFLKYNFHPAKIFLGDTGSQFIGYMLASISIISAIKYATAFSIFIPVLAFGVPIYDTLSTIIRRKLNNRPIMEADRGHLHHRLLDKGYSHIQTVLIMYALTVILGIISIIVSIYSNSILVIIFVVLIVIIKIIK